MRFFLLLLAMALSSVSFANTWKIADTVTLADQALYSTQRRGNPIGQFQAAWYDPEAFHGKIISIESGWAQIQTPNAFVINQPTEIFQAPNVSFSPKQTITPQHGLAIIVSTVEMGTKPWFQIVRQIRPGTFGYGFVMKSSAIQHTLWVRTQHLRKWVQFPGTTPPQGFRVKKLGDPITFGLLMVIQPPRPGARTIPVHNVNNDQAFLAHFFSARLGERDVMPIQTLTVGRRSTAIDAQAVDGHYVVALRPSGRQTIVYLNPYLPSPFSQRTLSGGKGIVLLQNPDSALRVRSSAIIRTDNITSHRVAHGRIVGFTFFLMQDPNANRDFWYQLPSPESENTEWWVSGYGLKEIVAVPTNVLSPFSEQTIVIPSSPPAHGPAATHQERITVLTQIVTSSLAPPTASRRRQTNRNQGPSIPHLADGAIAEGLYTTAQHYFNDRVPLSWQQFSAQTFVESKFANVLRGPYVFGLMQIGAPAVSDVRRQYLRLRTYADDRNTLTIPQQFTINTHGETWKYVPQNLYHAALYLRITALRLANNIPELTQVYANDRQAFLPFLQTAYNTGYGTVSETFQRLRRAANAPAHHNALSTTVNDPGGRRIAAGSKRLIVAIADTAVTHFGAHKRTEVPEYVPKITFFSDKISELNQQRPNASNVSDIWDHPYNLLQYDTGAKRYHLMRTFVDRFWTTR